MMTEPGSAIVRTNSAATRSLRFSCTSGCWRRWAMRVSSGATATVAIAKASRIAASFHVNRGRCGMVSTCAPMGATADNTRHSAAPSWRTRLTRYPFPNPVSRPECSRHAAKPPLPASAFVADYAAPHRDFVRVLEIREKALLSLAADLGVLDQRVELVVDRHAQHVEVRRADAHPATVHDARLGVHHFALPLPHAHAVHQQSAVIAPRQQRDPRMVVAAGHEDADVDTVARGAGERFDLGPGRNEVRARD